MQYQLVIQFRPTAALDLEQLLSIEGSLIDELGDSASVDGHDIGSGEFNIFILTDNPNGSFQSVQKLLRGASRTEHVAYRDTDGEDYVAFWPPNLAEFKVA